MKRAILILLTSLALTAPADACDILAGFRQRVQARRDARKAAAYPVATVSHPAPATRPAYLPETLPVLTGPVATAVRQCAGASCPK